MIAFDAAIILCRITEVKNNVTPNSRELNFVLDYRVRRCRITKVVFYTKVLVNDILVGLERILSYVVVGLENSTVYGCAFIPW